MQQSWDISLLPGCLYEVQFFYDCLFWCFPSVIVPQYPLYIYVYIHGYVSWSFFAPFMHGQRLGHWRTVKTSWCGNGATGCGECPKSTWETIKQTLSSHFHLHFRVCKHTSILRCQRALSLACPSKSRGQRGRDGLCRKQWGRPLPLLVLWTFPQVFVCRFHMGSWSSLNTWILFIVMF